MSDFQGSIGGGVFFGCNYCNVCNRDSAGDFWKHHSVIGVF